MYHSVPCVASISENIEEEKQTRKRKKKTSNKEESKERKIQGRMGEDEKAKATVFLS